MSRDRKDLPSPNASHPAPRPVELPGAGSSSRLPVLSEAGDTTDELIVGPLSDRSDIGSGTLATGPVVAVEPSASRLKAVEPSASRLKAAEPSATRLRAVESSASEMTLPAAKPPTGGGPVAKSARSPSKAAATVETAAVAAIATIAAEPLERPSAATRRVGVMDLLTGPRHRADYWKVVDGWGDEQLRECRHLLESADRELRGRAAAVLAHRRDARAVPRLIKMMTRSDAAVTDICLAAEALARLKCLAALPLLEKLSRGGRNEVIRAVCRMSADALRRVRNAAGN